MPIVSSMIYHISCVKLLLIFSQNILMDIIHVRATKWNQPFLREFWRYVDIKVYFTECAEQLKFIPFKSFSQILTCNDMVLRKIGKFEESVFHLELFSLVVNKFEESWLATFLSDNLYVSHLSEQKNKKTSDSQVCPKNGKNSLWTQTQMASYCLFETSILA